MSHSFPIFSYDFIGDFPQVCYNCPIVYRRCPIVFLSFSKVLWGCPISSHGFPGFPSSPPREPRILRGQEDGGTAAQGSTEDDHGAVAHPQIIHQISEDRQRHFKDGLAAISLSVWVFVGWFFLFFFHRLDLDDVFSLVVWKMVWRWREFDGFSPWCFQIYFP